MTSIEALIVYDVSTTTPQARRRLRNVARICQKYGCRVQASVFEVVLPEPLFAALRIELLRVVVPSEDSLCLYRLDRGTLARVERIGREVSTDMDPWLA